MAILGFAHVTELLRVHSQNWPRIQLVYDSYVQLWRLYIELGVTVPMRRVQLHMTIIENILL